jgi:HEAT repeat protein
MKILRGPIAALLLIFACAGVQAYDRDAALAYSEQWWDTNLVHDPEGLVDHVNSRLQCSTCPYTWYYLGPRTFAGISIPILSVARSNGGDSTVPKSQGADCSNFVSQVLKAGGIRMPGDGGRGDTYKEVARLGAALKTISAQTLLLKPDSPVPADAALGDVVEFQGLPHMAVVVGLNPIRLRYHTTDTREKNLRSIRAEYFPAVFHHIIKDVITASADTTPPTVIVRSGDAVVPNEGSAPAGILTIEVSDSGDGVQNLEVTRGAPIVDTPINFESGAASYVFRDRTARDASHSYVVDLGPLRDGETVFVQAFDAAGNVSANSFVIRRETSGAASASKVSARQDSVAPELGAVGDQKAQARLDIQTLRELCAGNKDLKEIKKIGFKAISSLAKTNAEATPLLIDEFRQESNDWRYRYLLLEQLSRTKDVRVVDVAAHAAGDGRAEIRRLAVVTLGLSGQEPAADTLQAALEDKDVEIRLYSAQGLGRLKHRKSIDHLIRRLRQEPHFGVRMSIVEALGNYRGREILDALVQAVKEDVSPDVRARAAWALGQSEMQEAAEPLCRSLDDRYVVVALNAAQALGKMRSRTCIPLLIKALSRNILRMEAANALGEVGDPTAIGPLETLTDTQDVVFEQAVRKALGKLKRL